MVYYTIIRHPLILYAILWFFCTKIHRHRRDALKINPLMDHTENRVSVKATASVIM